MERVRTMLGVFQPFVADLVDEIEVYDSKLMKFTKCEHWGWNEEGENEQPFYDFGMIGQFHFDIYKDRVDFYFGDMPRYGTVGLQSKDLIFLRVGESLPSNFFNTGHLNFSLSYNYPNTLNDFIKYIENYYARLNHHKEYLRRTYFLTQ